MARQDAQDVLTPDLLAIYYGGDLKAAKNDAFVGRFIAKLSPKERADAMDAKGNPSLQVLQRIRNALLYKAYGESGRASEIFISKAMERADDDTKTLTNSLVEAANDWIKFQQDIAAGNIDPKYDITDKIMEAVATVSDIKQRGLKVRDALRADDLVEPLDPFVKDILLAFHNEDVTRFVSKNVIANILNNYAETAAVQQAAPDMLGMSETPSADELWRRADRETPKSAKAQQEMLQPAEPTAEQVEDLSGMSIDQRAIVEEARKIPSLSRAVRSLIDQYYLTEIDAAEFATRVTELSDYIDDMRSAKKYRQAKKGRARGADRILEVLYREKRKGNLSPESVDFAAWFIGQNPNVANDLGISILEGKEESPAGKYTDFSRLMTLFKNRAQDTTAVHEMLHHTERMMPQDVQDAIRATWLREFAKAEKAGQSKPQLQSYFKALRALHSNTKFTFAGKSYNPDQAFGLALAMIENGHVPYSYYQYVNPSEFWAVNATDIMQKRFDVKDSVLERLKNWLSELAEKAKGLFNLSAKSPLIKALDSLAKADGKFNSLTMIQEADATYLKPEPEAGIQKGKVTDNAQVFEVLNSADPVAMKKAIAKAEETNDKIMNERANLQKQNRGCD
jgi:hypothetical protein